MVDLQRADSLWSLNLWGSPRGRGGSRPTSRRQNCHAPHSRRPGASTVPRSISSRRVRVDPSTSGTATRAPASGAGGGLVAAAVGGAGSRAAPTAPGEAPSPALPGAAPSCGPAGAGDPRRDWESPGPAPAVVTMMMMHVGRLVELILLLCVLLRSAHTVRCSVSALRSGPPREATPAQGVWALCGGGPRGDGNPGQPSGAVVR